MIQQRITDRSIPLKEDQINILRQLDTLLNYFENLLYLEESGLLSSKERLVLFQYWFDLLKAENRGEIRRYINLYGWERVAAVVGQIEKNYLFLYGTLKEGEKGYRDLGLQNYLKPRGEDKILGTMYNLGNYPGVKLNGITEIHGCLYEVVDLAVFEALDKFERFDPNDAENSLYVRRCIRTKISDVDAWIYEYNKLINVEQKIASGKWDSNKSDAD